VCIRRIQVLQPTVHEGPASILQYIHTVISNKCYVCVYIYSNSAGQRRQLRHQLSHGDVIIIISRLQRVTSTICLFSHTTFTVGCTVHCHNRQDMPATSRPSGNISFFCPFVIVCFLFVVSGLRLSSALAGASHNLFPLQQHAALQTLCMDCHHNERWSALAKLLVGVCFRRVYTSMPIILHFEFMHHNGHQDVTMCDCQLLHGKKRKIFHTTITYKI
jgi:hypothetical protein